MRDAGKVVTRVWNSERFFGGFRMTTVEWQMDCLAAHPRALLQASPGAATVMLRRECMKVAFLLLSISSVTISRN